MFNVKNLEESSLENWSQVDWYFVNASVTNLRSRIFMSIRSGDVKKASKLQKIMLKSKSNLLWSIRKATQLSSGKRTPGVDEKVVIYPAKRFELYQQK